MSDRILKRNTLGNALGFVTVIALTSALSVHPQTTSASDASSGTAMSQKNPADTGIKGEHGTSGTPTGSTTGTSSGKANGAASSGMSGSTGATSSGSDTAGSSEKATSTGAMASKGSVSASDRTLMRELAVADLNEIAAAKLAQGKSTNDQVKSFAQKMIDDHTKSLEQLQQLAQAKGVQLPTEADAKHRAMEKKLGALSGEKFDHEYMQQAGTVDHRKAHQLVARVSRRAQDADLKALADKMQPDIEQHMQMAQQMRRGAAQTSSGK